MIPKILHRIWLGSPMPDEFAGYGERWRELHPEWQMREWYAPPDRMVNAHLFYRAIDHTRDWLRWQSDVMRLEILYRYGGVYVDCDSEPLRPLDDLLEDIECFAAWSPNRGDAGQRPVANGTIGCEPRHPFIAEAIRALPASVRAFAGNHIAHVTGPWHLTRVYEAQPWPDVTVFEDRIFYPVGIGARDRGEIVNLDGSYTTHVWATTRDRTRVVRPAKGVGHHKPTVT